MEIWLCAANETGTPLFWLYHGDSSNCLPLSGTHRVPSYELWTVEYGGGSQLQKNIPDGFESLKIRTVQPLVCVCVTQELEGVPTDLARIREAVLATKKRFPQALDPNFTFDEDFLAFVTDMFTASVKSYIASDALPLVVRAYCLGTAA